MNSTLDTLRASFSPLRYPNFRLYLGGQAISLIGTWLQNAAQAWVVWTLTDSVEALGTVQALATLPILLVGPFAGSLADRLDRRKLLIATQSVAMLLAFILATLVQTDLIRVWHVYILAMTLGVVTALDLPAQQAFLGDLAGMGEVRKAINLNIMLVQISRTLGPAVSGIMIARIGTAPSFWLNGLSFMAVIASLTLVRANQVRNPTSHVNPLRQWVEGLRFLRTQPRLQDLYIFAAIMTFLMFSVILTMLPAVATRILDGDAETAGYLQASSGFGALVAVVFIVPLAQAYRRSGFVLSGAAIWAGVWLFLFANSEWLVVSLVCLFFGSMGGPTIMTTAMGLIQVMAPNDMRGRLGSLFWMVSFGMQPIAAFLIGQSAHLLGIRTAIIINALLLMSASATLLLMRAGLRRWDVNVALPKTLPVESALD